MADPAQSPGVMRALINRLMGTRGAENATQMDPQMIEYGNYAKEQRAMGEPVMTMPEWQQRKGRNAMAPYLNQPAPAEQPKFRF